MKTRAFIFVLGILVITNISCQSELNKEAVHDIDNLLSKRMTEVMEKVAQDKSLGDKDKYNREITDEVERNKLHLEYLQEKLELMTQVRTEIDAGNEDIKLLMEKYPEGKPGHSLILAFKDYFEAYKILMDAMKLDLDNQINTSILCNTIVSLETNQQLFFNALDNNNVKQAQSCYEKEEELLKDYENNFKLVDFKGKVPSEWINEFRDTYAKMHEWLYKFLDAKKQRDEALYRKLRLEGFELVFKIPYEKNEKFRNEIEDILFEYNPETEALERKSAEAGKKAYILYAEKKIELGEDPNEILGNK